MPPSGGVSVTFSKGPGIGSGAPIKVAEGCLRFDGDMFGGCREVEEVVG